MALNENGDPVSVYSVLVKLSEENAGMWGEMVEDIFGCRTEFLSLETVLEKIEKTDTCSNLNSPVRVWIDSEGRYSVRVFEK